MMMNNTLMFVAKICRDSASRCSRKNIWQWDHQANKNNSLVAKHIERDMILYQLGMKTCLPKESFNILQIEHLCSQKLDHVSTKQLSRCLTSPSSCFDWNWYHQCLFALVWKTMSLWFVSWNCSTKLIVELAIISRSMLSYGGWYPNGAIAVAMGFSCDNRFLWRNIITKQWVEISWRLSPRPCLRRNLLKHDKIWTWFLSIAPIP